MNEGNFMRYQDCFTECRKGSLLFYRSSNLNCLHGFSTRLGGVSQPAHLASLNLGFDRGDEEAAVETNRSRFADAVGYRTERCVSAHQIHSDRVEIVGAADAGRKDYTCDGFVTRTNNLALLVKVADCVPILCCDAKNGVVAAIHAGWRGTVSGIAVKGIQTMLSCGASLSDVQVAIGACIHDCCYEVGEEVAQAIRTVTASSAVDFLHASPSGGKYMADIASLNAFLLVQAGVLVQNISLCRQCTCCAPNRFFSHRASQGKRGVMAAAIVCP